MNGWIARALRSRVHRLVQELPALAGSSSRLFDCQTEAVEFPNEVVEGRFELAANRPAAFGEQHVPCEATDHGARNRYRHCSRVIGHIALHRYILSNQFKLHATVCLG